MADKIRWGILATGDIARRFATGLKFLPDAEIIAVGSRSQKSADEFADKFGIPRRYPSYESLANDKDIEIVYIATPNSLHKDNCIMCLRAGKHVLCEKPFTINALEAEEVIATARAQKKFLMEAMWTRFLPAMKQVREWIDAGEIGEVRMAQASFGYRNGVGTTYDPKLGGGSLLDVGVYPITLADIAFGQPPERISSFAHIANGIDEQAALIFHYPGGGLALLATAICTAMPGDGVVMGTKGMIKIGDPFWRTDTLSLIRPGKNDLVIPTGLVAERRYNYQVQSVMECLRLGKIENEIMPWGKTLEIMRILDEIRGQIRLRYPMEK